ncbi:hypothetical protein BD769DRAFT_1675797 [Suillus cothurnatus]|nr:hypothetical protein BD769DRAFT_1675797 [Suillus cothurnatus]
MSRDKNGLPVNCVSKVLKHTQLVQQAASSNEQRQARLQAMSSNERHALEALKEDTNTTMEDWLESYDDMSFGDVWNGDEPLAISHAGGEFTDLAREVLGDLWKM